MSQIKIEYFVEFDDYGEWLISGRTPDEQQVPELLAQGRAYRPKLTDAQWQITKRTTTITDEMLPLPAAPL